MGILQHFIKRLPYFTRFSRINPIFSFSSTGSSCLMGSFGRSVNFSGSRVGRSCRNSVAMGLGLGFGLASSPAFANSNESEVESTEIVVEPSVNSSPQSNGECVTIKSGGRLNKLKIFVGYDPREDLAYEVCRYSILKRATIPVDIIPIKQSKLRRSGLYWRERGPTESTEFSFSRFLTPFLASFDGWALFVDCDFLYTADVKELVELVDDKYAIMCVQHDYTPKETTKMDGAVQTTYPRKNWSSMVLYNCGHPKNRILTPELVNSQTGAFLHRFMWLDDDEIGSIPFVWNFLVGHNHIDENDSNMLPKAIHYTMGGPWFDAWKDCEFGDLWVKEMEEYKRQEAELKSSNADSLVA